MVTSDNQAELSRLWANWAEAIIRRIDNTTPENRQAELRARTAFYAVFNDNRTHLTDTSKWPT